jgi:guanylate kinase
MPRLIILSGPSCVGKGPMVKALGRMYPGVAAPLEPIVLYNSRSPRPGEVDGRDYHFRTRDEMESLFSREGYLAMDVRGDLMAVDLEAVRAKAAEGEAFYEGNPLVAAELLGMDLPEGVRRLAVFVSPLSKGEIEEMKAPERHVSLSGLVADVMRRKLLRRTRRQKGELALTDLEEVERRCGSAYREMQTAWRYDAVIVNHDGEDSENWDAFAWPVGDARNAVHALAALLEGREARGVEAWGEDVVP